MAEGLTRGEGLVWRALGRRPVAGETTVVAGYVPVAPKDGRSSAWLRTETSAVA